MDPRVAVSLAPRFPANIVVKSEVRQLVQVRIYIYIYMSLHIGLKNRLQVCYEVKRHCNIPGPAQKETQVLEAQE